MRYYAPWLGRWSSPDPIGASQGLNTFAMVNSNPVSHRDIGGMGIWDDPTISHKITSFLTSHDALVMRLISSRAKAAYDSHPRIPTVPLHTIPDIQQSRLNPNAKPFISSSARKSPDNPILQKIPETIAELARFDISELSGYSAKERGYGRNRMERVLHTIRGLKTQHEILGMISQHFNDTVADRLRQASEKDKDLIHKFITLNLYFTDGDTRFYLPMRTKLYLWEEVLTQQPLAPVQEPYTDASAQFQRAIRNSHDFIDIVQRARRATSAHSTSHINRD